MGEAIVVGTDGSETAARAVSEAARLARGLSAELHIVTGRRNTEGALAAAPDVAGMLIAAPPEDAAYSQSIVEEAAASVRGDGLSVKTHVVEIEPAQALVEIASTVGAAMIVVGNRGMSGARRLLGSVPNRVSHTARCNVMIVSTSQPPRPG